jgi:hypothetical protein
MGTLGDFLSTYTEQSQMSTFYIDKMGVISIKSYGAIGDGVTDDTAKIQDAIDAVTAAGLTALFWPAGSYKVGTLTGYSAITFYSFDTVTFTGTSYTVSNFASIMSDIAVFAKNYGVSASSDDNHDAIVAAMDAAVASGMSTVFLPSGILETSPINFQGYTNLIIEGTASSFYSDFSDQAGTTLKIIAAGDVGLQFADIVNPYVGYTYSTSVSPWAAHSCKVRNIKLNCNSLVTVGINGNFDFTLENVTVQYALGDGIVFEDYTYPASLKNVYSNNNGRHGFYARAPMSTVYNLENCEFSRNHGYGMLIEGGTDPRIGSVVLQANEQGGLKISKVDTVHGTTNFLSMLLFESLYTEANGTLDVADPDYEGNFAVYITSYIQNLDTTTKPNFIKFTNCIFNASATGGSLKIDAVYGLILDNCSINFTTAVIASAYCATMEISGGPNVAYGGAPYPFIATYGVTDGANSIVVHKHGGVVGTRGRTTLLSFYIDTIAAEATVNMIPVAHSGLAAGAMAKGYPVSIGALGSILRGTIQKKTYGGANAGMLTATYVVGVAHTGNDPTTVIAGAPTVVLSPATEAFNEDIYVPMTYTLPTGAQLLGVQLTASADYVSDANTAVLFHVLVEF